MPGGSELAVAKTFLAGLVAQDFARLADVLAPSVHLRALLPGGLREWTGAADVADRFARWFGNTTHFGVLEATAGEVADRIQLQWRFRLQADRLGPGWFVVEQLAYADVDDQHQIACLDLLCTGYRPERSDG